MVFNEISQASTCCTTFSYLIVGKDHRVEFTTHIHELFFFSPATCWVCPSSYTHTCKNKQSNLKIRLCILKFKYKLSMIGQNNNNSLVITAAGAAAACLLVETNGGVMMRRVLLESELPIFFPVKQQKYFITCFSNILKLR